MRIATRLRKLEAASAASPALVAAWTEMWTALSAAARACGETEGLAALDGERIAAEAAWFARRGYPATWEGLYRAARDLDVPVDDGDDGASVRARGEA